MKRNIILVVLLVGLLCAGFYSETRQMIFEPARTSVATDDTALDGTTSGYTYQFSDKPSVAKGMDISFNYAEVIFYGTDANEETCNFKIYAYREAGPARLVYSGTVTLGTALRSTGVYYGDTITGTEYWLDPVYIVDSGNNRVASLAFDLLGYKYVYIEIDIPSSSQVTSISAEISGF